MAEEADMDLVEVSPDAKPPVCRIMDYGKFLFEENKKRHAAKKKQKQIQIKEVKFRPTIDNHDYQTKLRRVLRFLEENDKVKVTMMFRGRQVTHPEIGRRILERLTADVEGLGLVEQAPKMEGRLMTMQLAPERKPRKGTREQTDEAPSDEE